MIINNYEWKLYYFIGASTYILQGKFIYKSIFKNNELNVGHFSKHILWVIMQNCALQYILCYSGSFLFNILFELNKGCWSCLVHYIFRCPLQHHKFMMVCAATAPQTIQCTVIISLWGVVSWVGKSALHSLHRLQLIEGGGGTTHRWHGLKKLILT